MSITCPVVRVESTHPESQGPFIEINKSDFDPTQYTLYVEPVVPVPPPPPVVP